MATRDKKTPAGSGPKKGNASSPTPVRESTPSDASTEFETPALSEPHKLTEAQQASLDKITATLNEVIKRATEEVESKNTESPSRKKPGRKPNPKLAARNKLKTDLKAKTKTVVRRNITKKLLTAAKTEFAASPEKKVALLRRGFRGTKLKPDDELPKIRRKRKAPVKLISENGEEEKTPKPKLMAKRLRALKTQEIVDTIAKDTQLDSEAQNVIDQLDLNVLASVKKEVEKRRHSIEKAVYNEEEHLTALPPDFATFISMPRSGSPRSRRGRPRQLELRTQSPTTRNRSPYTTRSDSPARLLRNGKHRKLKDFQLLDGLQSDRKRRRVLSDEKNTEYWSESESSHCGSSVSAMENGVPDTQSDIEPLKVADENIDVESVDVKMEEEDNNNKLMPKELREEVVNETVTEKILILNQMAQNFNEVPTVVQENGVCPEEEVKEEIETKDLAPIETNGLSPLEPSTSPAAVAEEIKENVEPDIIPEQTIDVVTTPEKTETSSPTDEKPSSDDTNLPSDNSVDISDNLECNNSSDLGNNSIVLKLEESSVEEEGETLKLALEETTDAFEHEQIFDPPESQKETESQTELKLDVENIIEKLSESEEVDIMNVDEPGCSSAIEETPEQMQMKESILNALGLQSLKAAAEAKTAFKSKRMLAKTDSYTGTLKTVIKLNRSPEKKKGRGHLKMTFQKRGKGAYPNGNDGFDAAGSSPDDNTYYKVMTEESANWSAAGQSSDTAGANRKTNLSSNRSNTDGSSDHMSDEAGGEGEDANNPSKGKNLVIPEKASSFSIHPQRLCRDECCYCFGRFGLFDTPCHIGQMKNAERQRKILEIEKHLTTDSCLCDACYRHVDRKANVPLYSKQLKRSNSAGPPGPRLCHANGCQQDATHSVRRKWVLKMKRNLTQLQFDLDPTQSLHLIPVCETHYESLEKLMVCAMCKRRLARNSAHNIHSPEADSLNVEFEKRKLPIRLSTSKPSTSADNSDEKTNGSAVCKLCRYFANLLLKPPDNARPHTLNFFETYEKRLLHFHDVEMMDEAETEDAAPTTKEKPAIRKPKRAKLTKTKTDSVKNSDEPLEPIAPIEPTDPETRVNESTDSTTKEPPRVPSTTDAPTKSRSNSPEEVPKKTVQRLPKEAPYVVELHKVKKQQKTVEKLETNPSISVRQLFPGEDDLPLRGSVEFGNVVERTPEGWEKCNMTIQYDHDTKRLWQELQKPYGNHSSFLRHLVFLEKYFRNGDLLLAPQASHHATNYCESVQNRLRAYDNIPSHGVNMQPVAMLPFNNTSSGATPVRRPSISQSGIITGKTQSLGPKTSTPITTNSSTPSNFISPVSIIRQPTPSVPPSLIQLQPSRPPNAVIRLPQRHKVPLRPQKPTLMRPTLIPFSQAKNNNATITSGALTKQTEIKRPSGLVQVISNGKSYHVSLQDYNRMIALKQRDGVDLAPVMKPKPPSALSVLRQMSGGNVSEGDDKKMILPKIPKSLTVIPQTVRKSSSESQITQVVNNKPS